MTGFAVTSAIYLVFGFLVLCVYINIHVSHIYIYRERERLTIDEVLKSGFARMRRSKFSAEPYPFKFASF